MHQEFFLSSREEGEIIKLQINPERYYLDNFDGPPIHNENGLNGEQDEALQVHQLGVEPTGRNQQVRYVGQQYIKPIIIAKETISCKRKDDKEIIYHCIE